MLNFGYWTDGINKPLDAQQNLCNFVSKLADLETASMVADVGSGLSEPAFAWQTDYPQANIVCVNTSFKQLKFAKRQEQVFFVNSSATKLPFSDDSVDRIIALESAQHFRPFENFIEQSARILKSDGLLIIALPVTLLKHVDHKLGILKFTWSSEHYDLDFVIKSIEEHGFSIVEKKLVGKYVYEPLAKYYIENRQTLRQIILQKYPSYLESVLYKSIIKMKQVSEKHVIDYAILKCVIKS